MEGKELHDEDDDLKSGSKKDKEQESDDFGLPDASYESESEEEDRPSDEESSFEYAPDPEPEDEPTGFGEFEDDTPTYRYTPEEERSKSPTGLIVFLSLLGVLLIVFVIYWFFIRSPRVETEPEQDLAQQQEVIEEPVPQEPVVEETVEEEPEPVFIEEPEDISAGGFETINAQTGRYYIVLNSFFDGDLASDYANDLADRGVNTIIIEPPGGRGFHRVAIQEDYGNWNAAESRMAELKGTYGEDSWVLRY
jgi:hypothetical protein